MKARRTLYASSAVKYLTKQEQWVLTMVLSLLMIGWAVKTYRTASPPSGANHAAQGR